MRLVKIVFPRIEATLLPRDQTVNAMPAKIRLESLQCHGQFGRDPKRPRFAPLLPACRQNGSDQLRQGIAYQYAYLRLLRCITLNQICHCFWLLFRNVVYCALDRFHLQIRAPVCPHRIGNPR
jgi:hypothetical protein